MLSELGNDWRDYDVIGIDEGQFYNDVSHSFFAYFDFYLTYFMSRLSNFVIKPLTKARL